MAVQSQRRAPWRARDRRLLQRHVFKTVQRDTLREKLRRARSRLERPHVSAGADLLRHRQGVYAVVGANVDDVVSSLEQLPHERQLVLEEIQLFAQYVR